MHPLIARLRLLVVGVLLAPGVAEAQIQVSIWEGVAESSDGSILKGSRSDAYEVPAFGFVQIPAKVNARGIEIDRAVPYAIRAESTLKIAPGRRTLILRAKGAARLSIDGRVVARTAPIHPNSAGHEPVPEPAPPEDVRWREVAAGDGETIVAWTSDGREHTVELIAILGARGAPTRAGGDVRQRGRRARDSRPGRRSGRAYE